MSQTNPVGLPEPDIENTFKKIFTKLKDYDERFRNAKAGVSKFIHLGDVEALLDAEDRAPRNGQVWAWNLARKILQPVGGDPIRKQFSITDMREPQVLDLIEDEPWNDERGCMVWASVIHSATGEPPLMPIGYGDIPYELDFEAYLRDLDVTNDGGFTAIELLTDGPGDLFRLTVTEALVRLAGRRQQTPFGYLSVSNNVDEFSLGALAAGEACYNQWPMDLSQGLANSISWYVRHDKPQILIGATEGWDGDRAITAAVNAVVVPWL